MKKSFEKGFITPLPVLIIATYDENGTPDAMNAAWGGQVGGSQISISLGKLHPIMFDSAQKCYREIGASVGGAWAVGKKFE